MVYFRWRPSLYGQEQYHEGILKHDASPGTGFRALEKLQGEWKKLEALSAGSRPAEVALIFDYEDLWALHIQPHRRGLMYLTHLFRLYRSLQQLGVPIDIVPRGAALGSYKLVLAPQAHLGDRAFANSLVAYVRRGGTVLMTIRSGFKTLKIWYRNNPFQVYFKNCWGSV